MLIILTEKPLLPGDGEHSNEWNHSRFPVSHSTDLRFGMINISRQETVSRRRAGASRRTGSPADRKEDPTTRNRLHVPEIA